MCYNKSRKDIKGEGCRVNQHDIWTTSRIIKGKQRALNQNCGDAKVSRAGSGVNDKSHEQTKKKFGSDELGNVTKTHGKRYDCLGAMLGSKKKHHVGAKTAC